MLSLNYKEYGTGTQHLIILHGFLGSLDNWHSLSTEWANAGLHVYAVDQRNHGRSPHTDEHTISLMADDLRDFMEEHELKDAVILGHSMGGKVAMQFALDHPELCTKLIVADMAPRQYKPGHDDVFEAIFNVSLDKIETRKDAEEAMKPYLGDPGTRQFIMKSLERQQDGTYAWKFNLKTLYQDYAEITRPIETGKTYEKPALFLKGELSRYIKDEDLPEIRQLFPHSDVISVEGAGHWLHADNPKAFFEAVLHFTSN
jgi:esterase